MACVALIGTLDTKGDELEFVRNELERRGAVALLVDVGILGSPSRQGDVTREEVAEAAGTTLSSLQEAGDRGEAVTAMAKGAAIAVRRLFDEGRIQGVLSLGGSAGTTIGTSAMRALPFGVPKLMVSTLASGDTSPYVGTRDICMVYSVVDVAGLNRVSRRVFINAAAGMAGMMGGLEPAAEEDALPTIGATMFGVTTPCVTRAREELEAAGYEVLVFHATGTGGRAMEDLIRDGVIRGVLDATTTELADELVGGVLSAGPDRLEIAGELGVPQVVSAGALDMVNFGPWDTVPERFRERRLYRHNPSITLMRTTPEENAELGRIIGGKLSKARGPTAFFLPLGGVSAIDRPGQPFYWPEADDAFRQGLKAVLSNNVELFELELNINDPAFAEAMAAKLWEYVEGSG
jgi:uncharacterized protein (UPF0261 family)